MHQATGTVITLKVRPRRGVNVFSRGGPRYLFASFNTFTGQTIAVPLCTADSPTRTRCVVGSTRVHCLFMNRRFRCSTTFDIFKFYRSLRRLVVFSHTIIGSPHSVASVCFSRFVTVSRRLRRGTVMRRHATTTSSSSLTGVLCASNAANRPGNIVLRRFGCERTFHVRSVQLPFVASRSISVGFLPLARMFRGT